jgi:hypothetical protein
VILLWLALAFIGADGERPAPRFTGKSIPDGVEDAPHIRLAGPPAAGFGRDVGSIRAHWASVRSLE